ncbi:GyrI-like domain-containing protein [Yinghuangia soli]|uniref:GyrI-like domain-containing protein n=1 Tax=Yinghuangia soli TaxID=2908204 RepID=A0AA41U0K5_9ACTN|nr:GyrI-like domain-containing protein [Yinghuangia soli]MCF2528691.1 GyrI-like domain-containing protein [Yinghuangia soli]
MTPKADLKKTHSDLYGTGAAPVFVDVPALPYLMIDGTGDPDGPVYAESVGALYGVAYAIRFALKGAGVLEYPVMPLEGLWWDADDGSFDHRADRGTWRWTMMILQPPAAADYFAEAAATAARKKPASPVARVRYEEAPEERAVQILHTGPYAEETPAIEKLLAHAAAGGAAVTGLHREIYLSNPSRTAPEKLKTLIRYAVTPGKS